MQIEPIGVIRTPFARQDGTPIQPAAARGARGTVELRPEFSAALQDLDGFSHIWLLYWFDRAAPYRPLVVPYLDDRERGLFATRAPCRPNPLGMSVVRLLHIRGCTLEVADVDILDGTPLLDIKPYAPRFDCLPEARAGWLDRSAAQTDRADGRFAGDGPAGEGQD